MPALHHMRKRRTWDRLLRVTGDCVCHKTSSCTHKLVMARTGAAGAARPRPRRAGARRAR